MKVLGIETSCDETAAAIVSKGPSGEPIILSNVIYSQIEEHAAFGGVVPEIAARSHVTRLDRIIEQALRDAALKIAEVDAIAVTSGPGLIGGLIAGVMTAKAIAAAVDLPLIAINHLEGHALTPRLTDSLDFPYLLLLVSGGHSQFVEVKDIDSYRLLATTIDDALGEAFDKTAKLLSLGYPGGPQVEEKAKRGSAERFHFPRSMPGKNELNFSFSGLKTAVRQAAEKASPLKEQDVADICASFQAAVVDVLANRASKVIDLLENEPEHRGKTLVVAGGVAANAAIRQALLTCCEKRRWQMIAPPPHLCTDNAAMIAWAGLERFASGNVENAITGPRPRWPLDEAHAGIVGSGKKGAKV